MNIVSRICLLLYMVKWAIWIVVKFMWIRLGCTQHKLFLNKANDILSAQAISPSFPLTPIKSDLLLLTERGFGYLEVSQSKCYFLRGKSAIGIWNSSLKKRLSFLFFLFFFHWISCCCLRLWFQIQWVLWTCTRIEIIHFLRLAWTVIFSRDFSLDSCNRVDASWPGSCSLSLWAQQMKPGSLWSVVLCGQCTCDKTAACPERVGSQGWGRCGLGSSFVQVSD